MGSDPPLHQESWQQIKGWYKSEVGLSPSPARVTLDWITSEQVELHSYIPPPGTNILISVEPLLVEDLVPTEDKIEWEVKCLRNRRSGGASGMRVEHMKRWLSAARKAEKDATMAAGVETTENKGATVFKTSMEPTEAAKWEMVVELVQTAFR